MMRMTAAAAEWRTVFRQAGIREPVLGLLRAAEAEGWPEAETALKLWAYLTSRINTPLHEMQTVWPPTPSSNFWNRMGKACRCIVEVWAGRNTVDRAAAARAFFLRGTEFYLTCSETQRAEWTTLDQLAGDLSAVGDELANSAHEEPMDRAQPPITRVTLESWEDERNGPQRPLGPAAGRSNYTTSPSCSLSAPPSGKLTGPQERSGDGQQKPPGHKANLDMPQRPAGGGDPSPKKGSTPTGAAAADVLTVADTEMAELATPTVDKSLKPGQNTHGTSAGAAAPAAPSVTGSTAIAGDTTATRQEGHAAAGSAGEAGASGLAQP
ncbi:UNVERIFIED_CONTAM: hypothetical protein K2H54_002087 [Gekko kuhli]